jgi:osmotically-inducible protein OsmY
MNRTAISRVLLVLIVLAATACGSMNRVTPAGADDAAMEADIRAKIAEEIPGKTFDIGVSVKDGVATLSGSVATDADRRRIADAARSVNGVKSVINNLQLQ